jgi:hypothetical protein
VQEQTGDFRRRRLPQAASPRRHRIEQGMRTEKYAAGNIDLAAQELRSAVHDQAREGQRLLITGVAAVGAVALISNTVKVRFISVSKNTRLTSRC